MYEEEEEEYHKNNFHTKKIGRFIENFAISEFFRHLEYDFLKEHHKNNIHTKN